MKEQNKSGTATSQGKVPTLEEKRAATRALRKLRREARAFARDMEYKHSVQVRNRVLVCGLVQVARRNLDVLTNAVSYPVCYLGSREEQNKAMQAAIDLNAMLDRLDQELTSVAREQGLP